MSKVRVFNLSSGEERFYHDVSPETAVYFANKQKGVIEYAGFYVLCGYWSARKEDITDEAVAGWLSSKSKEIIAKLQPVSQD